MSICSTWPRPMDSLRRALRDSWTVRVIVVVLSPFAVLFVVSLVPGIEVDFKSWASAGIPTLFFLGIQIVLVGSCVFWFFGFLWKQLGRLRQRDPLALPEFKAMIKARTPEVRRLTDEQLMNDETASLRATIVGLHQDHVLSATLRAEVNRRGLSAGWFWKRWTPQGRARSRMWVSHMTARQDLYKEALRAIADRYGFKN